MNLRMNLLGLAVAPLLVNVPVGAAGGERVTTTVYVGRHFEVRDQDQPVKYVLNGDTRVAHLTGSLSSGSRLQRLRLQPGWNSLSLAVTATNLIGQLNQFATEPAPLVRALYRWQPAALDYAEVNPGQTIEAGAVLWLKARTNAAVAVTGRYVESAVPQVPRGGGYVPSPGLENWSPTLPVGVTAWKYDPQSGAWRAAFTGDLALMSDTPPALAPGEAIYIHNSEAVELELPDPAQRVLYDHSDHLGSSAVVTDANGAVVRESAYYPFGALRHDERPFALETRYGFARKERDRESGLADFGHRYLNAALGRWLNPDPLRENGGGSNPYAYVNQNPLKYEDPDGAEIKVTRTIDTKTKTVSYRIHLKAAFIDAQQTKFSQQQLAQITHKLKCQIAASFTGSAVDKQRIGKTVEKWNFKWSTTTDIRLVDDWSEIKKDEHVFRIVERLPGARGETRNGGMLISLRGDIFNSKPGERTAEGTGAHEFGHASGLSHHNDSHNLMMDGKTRPADALGIGLYQIQSIYEASANGRLNQRERVMDELDADARRKR
jgi:RHS repeat-associated protein